MHRYLVRHCVCQPEGIIQMERSLAIQLGFWWSSADIFGITLETDSLKSDYTTALKSNIQKISASIGWSFDRFFRDIRSATSNLYRLVAEALYIFALMKHLWTQWMQWLGVNVLLEKTDFHSTKLKISCFNTSLSKSKNAKKFAKSTPRRFWKSVSFVETSKNPSGLLALMPWYSLSLSLPKRFQTVPFFQKSSIIPQILL
jgi:hypothetical protein